ncbi:MAG: alpha/beta fold hydrolase [Tahibacter sp.]
MSYRSKCLIAIASLFGALLMPAACVFAQAIQPVPDLRKSVEFLAMIDHGDFEGALAHASPALRAALPATKLAETWTAVTQQVGPCQPLGAPVIQFRDGHPLIVAAMPCAVMSLELLIGVDGAGAIAGFHIAPAARTSDATFEANEHFVEAAINVGPAARALGATLTLPRGDGPFAGVVLVHGSGPHDRDETLGPNKPFVNLAHDLARHGIAVLRYDKRTWSRPGDFAGGQFTVDDELVNDAVAAAEVLRQSPHIDPGRIVVAGHSLGALMAPRIAQRAPWIAGAVLLAAPARPLQDIVVDQRRYLAELDGGVDATERAEIAELEHQRDEINKLDPQHPPTHPLMLRLPATYWADLRAYDPVALAKMLPTPLLILQGARDYQVRPAQELVLWRRAFSDTKRVRIIEYATLSHIFETGSEPPGPSDYAQAGHVDTQVSTDIANWIDQLPAGATTSP